MEQRLVDVLLKWQTIGDSLQIMETAEGVFTLIEALRPDD